MYIVHTLDKYNIENMQKNLHATSCYEFIFIGNLHHFFEASNLAEFQFNELSDIIPQNLYLLIKNE